MCRVDLSLIDGDLVNSERCVLVAYTMKPNVGHEFLASAEHLAAAASAGPSGNVCTVGDFTQTEGAMVCYIH